MNAPAEVTRDNFVMLLLDSVEELKRVVDEHLSDMGGELLLHLLMSDIRRFTFAAFGEGRFEVSSRILEFLDHSLRRGDDSVKNAVAVSFVDDSAWWAPESQEFIATWPAALMTESERQRNWQHSGENN